MPSSFWYLFFYLLGGGLFAFLMGMFSALVEKSDLSKLFCTRKMGKDYYGREKDMEMVDYPILISTSVIWPPVVVLLLLLLAKGWVRHVWRFLKRYWKVWFKGYEEALEVLGGNK